MKKLSATRHLLPLSLLFVSKLMFAAPGNDACSGATLLTVSNSCTTITGTLVGATTAGGLPTPTCGAIAREVWYQFVAATSNPTISLSNIGTNITGAGGTQGQGAVVQILSGTNCAGFALVGTCAMPFISHQLLFIIV